MSARAPSNPHASAQAALAWEAAAEQARMPVAQAPAWSLEVVACVDGLARLVDPATGERLGVAGSVAVLERTRNFFR